MLVEPVFGAVEGATSVRDAASRPDGDDDAQYVRTQFLRRVAHDIASPTGVTITVLDELAASSSRPELVAMAKRGLRRLLRLSEQLALVADLEAGSVVPDTTPEDVRNLVQEAVDRAVAIDGRREVKARCDFADEKLIVEVDRRLVAGSIREIVGNALRLASTQVVVTLTVANDLAVIRVEDDGAGFAEDVAASIEDRLCARPGVRGLGLSLSMAKEILAAHGGDLRVGTSTLPPGRRGQGAAVVITLPLARGSKAHSTNGGR